VIWLRQQTARWVCVKAAIKFGFGDSGKFIEEINKTLLTMEDLTKVTVKLNVCRLELLVLSGRSTV